VTGVTAKNGGAGAESIGRFPEGWPRRVAHGAIRRGDHSIFGATPLLAALVVIYFTGMKSSSQRNQTTLGEFIMAAYDTWGKRRGRGAVRLAIKTHLVEADQRHDDSFARRGSK